jgi:maleylpyruvate isomerase
MTDQVPAAVDAVVASTDTLMRTVTGLTDGQAREPSLLPGWSRGHVLTHLARNADALGNLVSWARTGVETPMYPSREARAAAIEAGAARSAAELVEDLASASVRLVDAMSELDDADWATTIATGRPPRTMAARRIPVLRREEVEIHHVDLDLGYTLAHLPDDFVQSVLSWTTADLSARDDVPGFELVASGGNGRWTVRSGGPEITGPAPALLGWLIGRTDGTGVHSDAPFPELGPWR